MIEDKTFVEYIHTVKEALDAHPEWRHGQACMNVLDTFRPGLADQIRNDSELDPFYLDSRVPAFMDWLVTNW